MKLCQCGHSHIVCIHCGGSIAIERPRVKKVLELGRMKPTKTQTSASDRKVYAAVAARDQACTVQTTALGPCSGPLQIDHQWGRGKEPTREDNCRRLCKRHHDMKTDSSPNRALWLLDYAAHSRLLKHHVEADKARRFMDLELAQHPEARAEARKARTTP